MFNEKIFKDVFTLTYMTIHYYTVTQTGGATMTYFKIINIATAN